MEAAHEAKVFHRNRIASDDERLVSELQAKGMIVSDPISNPSGRRPRLCTNDTENALAACWTKSWRGRNELGADCPPPYLRR